MSYLETLHPLPSLSHFINYSCRLSRTFEGFFFNIETFDSYGINFGERRGLRIQLDLLDNGTKTVSWLTHIFSTDTSLLLLFTKLSGVFGSIPGLSIDLSVAF